MTPKAVLFDCDGVIVDSEGMTLIMLQADLANHGLLLTLHDLETNFIGGTIETVAERAIEAGAALPDGWADAFYQKLYAMLAVNTPLMPGIMAVLDALDLAGIPYAIGSNGTMRKGLPAFGPAAWMSASVCACAVCVSEIDSSTDDMVGNGR